MARTKQTARKVTQENAHRPKTVETFACHVVCTSGSIQKNSAAKDLKKKPSALGGNYALEDPAKSSDAGVVSDLDVGSGAESDCDSNASPVARKSADKTPDRGEVGKGMM